MAEQTLQFSGKRLLIVEDDMNTLPLYALEDLMYRGLEVYTIRDQVQAEQYISSNQHYELLIVDRELPGTAMHSGEDIVRLSREIKPNTPIIMVSGYGEIKKPQGVNRMFCKLGMDREGFIKSITNFLTRIE